MNSRDTLSSVKAGIQLLDQRFCDLQAEVQDNGAKQISIADALLSDRTHLNSFENLQVAIDSAATK